MAIDQKTLEQRMDSVPGLREAVQKATKSWDEGGRMFRSYTLKDVVVDEATKSAAFIVNDHFYLGGGCGIGDTAQVYLFKQVDGTPHIIHADFNYRDPYNRNRDTPFNFNTIEDLSSSGMVVRATVSVDGKYERRTLTTHFDESEPRVYGFRNW